MFMQKIIHEVDNIHEIFDDFDLLYTLLSQKEPDNSLIMATMNSNFEYLVSLFENTGWHGNISLNHYDYSYLSVPRNEKNIILCFTGGKDSVATAQILKEQGYNVYLYYMRGINPTFTDEYKIALECADYLNLPIYIDSCTLCGHHDYVEHPMKNMIIANGALQYGISEGLTVQIAFGNYYTSSIEDDNFEFCGGDDIEMWEIYINIISSVIPGFEMKIVLENLDETLSVVCKDSKLLDHTLSCLCRTALRPYWHERMSNKHNVKLPKYRCGRCYKCCVEYIYMADHDMTEYSDSYYKYCFSNLRRNYEKEHGKKTGTVDNVWNNYFLYERKREL